MLVDNSHPTSHQVRKFETVSFSKTHARPRPLPPPSRCSALGNPRDVPTMSSSHQLQVSPNKTCSKPVGFPQDRSSSLCRFDQKDPRKIHWANRKVEASSWPQHELLSARSPEERPPIDGVPLVVLCVPALPNQNRTQEPENA